MRKFAAALEIAFRAIGLSVYPGSAQPFEIMRIMNRGLDSAGSPTKPRMTLRTPHLVASVDFKEGCGAFGAVSRILG